MRLRKAIVAMTLAVGLAKPIGSAAAATQSDPEINADSRICGAETLRQEKLLSIPDRLLHAISLVESGRWDADRQASFAWPWTVTAEGQGRFLPDKAAAIAEVRGLQAKGIANIDVGCMQVNLQAHPAAFVSLDEAFDPAINVAYGARFLTELRAGTPDWETAAAYYHSQTPALAAGYKTHLVEAWSAAKSHADDRLIGFADAIQPPIGMVLPTPAHDPGELQAASSATGAAVAADRAVKLARTEAERVEAKRIADAYRDARMAEYRRHKLQLADAHG